MVTVCFPPVGFLPPGLVKVGICVSPVNVGMPENCAFPLKFGNVFGPVKVGTLVDFVLPSAMALV